MTVIEKLLTILIVVEIVSIIKNLYTDVFMFHLRRDWDMAIREYKHAQDGLSSDYLKAALEFCKACEQIDKIANDKGVKP